MKKAFLAIALLLVISGKGQNDSLKRSLHWNAFGFQLGAVAVPTDVMNQSFLARLTTNDTSIGKDFSTFKESKLNSPGAFHFNAYAVFVPTDGNGKRNERIEFRIGFIFQDTPQRGIEFKRRDSTRVDTFASSGTGMTVYKDSFANHAYSFVYHGQKAGLDLSNTFQLNKHKAVRIYAGFNFCIFYSYNNYIKSGYSDSEYGRGWYRKNFGYYDVHTTHLKDNFLLSASVPFGCTMRLLSKKKNIVQRPAINAEARIGVTEDKIGDKVLSLRPWCVVSFGLKFYRHKVVFYKD